MPSLRRSPLTALPAALLLLLGACGPGGSETSAGNDGVVGSGPGSVAPVDELPDISSFLDQPSTTFIVDEDVVGSGHPFLGARAASPHSGAHVHFDRAADTWPRGGDSPVNYPPIYAAATGTVVRRDDTMRVGANDRYGLSIEFARDARSAFVLDYSIEPMVPEPSPGFYAGFIVPKVGDRVQAGDVVAYMYTPRGANGTHIHFDLMRSDAPGFYAPAIFSPDVMAAFSAQWGGLGTDGGAPIDPTCMGWKLAAEENPYGTGALDCLKP